MEPTGTARSVRDFLASCSTSDLGRVLMEGHHSSDVASDPRRNSDRRSCVSLAGVHPHLKTTMIGSGCVQRVKRCNPYARPDPQDEPQILSPQYPEKFIVVPASASVPVLSSVIGSARLPSSIAGVPALTVSGRYFRSLRKRCRSCIGRLPAPRVDALLHAARNTRGSKGLHAAPTALCLCDRFTERGIRRRLAARGRGTRSAFPCCRRRSTADSRKFLTLDADASAVLIRC